MLNIATQAATPQALSSTPSTAIPIAQNQFALLEIPSGDKEPPQFVATVTNSVATLPAASRPV